MRDWSVFLLLLVASIEPPANWFAILWLILMVGPVLFDVLKSLWTLWKNRHRS